MPRMKKLSQRRGRSKRSDRFGSKFGKKRVCRFCAEPKIKIDYKDARALTVYITERGKIVPRRITSTCAYHQRELANAIKRARQIALIPYTATQVNW